MSFRSYGIVEDTENHLLVLGTKKVGYLQGFLVFFGGKVEQGESSKEALVREVAEETQKRVVLLENGTSRFESLRVTEPKAQTLIFFRCTNATYAVGEIPHGEEIGSVVAVSLDKLLIQLPDDPKAVTPADVANALIVLHGGGSDVGAYRSSGTMRALRDYLLIYHYRD